MKCENQHNLLITTKWRLAKCEINLCFSYMYIYIYNKYERKDFDQINLFIYLFLLHFLPYQILQSVLATSLKRINSQLAVIAMAMATKV